MLVFVNIVGEEDVNEILCGDIVCESERVRMLRAISVYSC